MYVDVATCLGRTTMSTNTESGVLLCGEHKLQPTNSVLMAISEQKTAIDDDDEVDEQNTKLLILEKYFSYRLPGQHYYNGIMWNGIVSRASLLELDTFQVKPDDVIVTGYPKSGTTWLEEIVYLIEHNVDLEKSNSIPVYIRVPYLEGDQTRQMIDGMESPRIFKTHLTHKMLPKEVRENKTKIVHVTRDPHDIAVSYYHFYRSLSQLGNYTGTWDDFLKMFMAGYICCGDWFEYINDWLQHKDESNILFVKYEDMKHDLRSSVIRIATFLGKSLDDEQVNRTVQHTTFENMKNNPSLNLDGVPHIDSSISPFMRKGEVGDWKNYFSTSQFEAFDRLMSRKLGQWNCLI